MRQTSEKVTARNGRRISASHRRGSVKRVGTVDRPVTGEREIPSFIILAISVVRGVPSIDSTTSAVSATIPERSLTQLPLDSRNLFKAAISESGVAPTPSSAPSLPSNGKTGQVSINGMRPSWTNVLIDGMDANDPVFGFSPAGASGLFLRLDELVEVSVLTQTFNADYGTHGGGVIEAITKSGSNQLHGSLFELHRDAALAAKNYFDLPNLPIPQFVRNRFGAHIGGPLVHDRTFMFVSYEGFREVQASTAIATVPDAPAHEGLLPSASDPSACSGATKFKRVPFDVGGSWRGRNREVVCWAL